MAELCKDLKIFTDRDYDLMVIGEGVFGTGIQSDSGLRERFFVEHERKIHTINNMIQSF
jgi:hypothetical protein